jgi:hypothetical protein
LRPSPRRSGALPNCVVDRFGQRRHIRVCAHRDYLERPDRNAAFRAGRRPSARGVHRSTACHGEQVTILGPKKSSSMAVSAHQGVYPDVTEDPLGRLELHHTKSVVEAPAIACRPIGCDTAPGMKSPTMARTAAEIDRCAGMRAPGPSQAGRVSRPPPRRGDPLRPVAPRFH